MNGSDDFLPVARVAEQMAGFERPWMVAGGWALDLYLGRRTRPHKDVDLAIFREDQLALRAYLGGWTFDYFTKVPERPREVWAEGMWLGAPVHEIWAAPPELGRVEQPGAHPLALEILMNERAGDEWLFRKDLNVKLPISRAVLRTDAGVPILAPEAVLLYKSGLPREVDEAELASVVPVLPPEARAWLRQAIERGNPGHHWLRQL